MISPPSREAATSNAAAAWRTGHGSLPNRLTGRWKHARRYARATGRVAPGKSPGPGKRDLPWPWSPPSGWEPSGNHRRSPRLYVALFCSPVHGTDLRHRDSDLVVGIGTHGWGSRGRRFKSGRPGGFSNALWTNWERNPP